MAIMDNPKPDTADILSAKYGCHFQRQGRDRVTNCPLPKHDDRTPSFHVFPDGSWRCYGCNGHGDALDAIRGIENVSLYEAIRVLNDLQPSLANLQTAQRLVDEQPRMLTDEELAAVNVASDYYASRLRADQDALAYLHLRGLDLDFAVANGIGVSRGAGLRRALIDRKVSEEAAKSVGLLGASGYERMTDRLTLPHRANGRVTWLCGRLIDSPARRRRVRAQVHHRHGQLRMLVHAIARLPQSDPNRPQLIDRVLVETSKIEWLLQPPKYLNVRGGKPLFGLPEEPTPVLLLVEGPIDNLVLAQWGYPSAAVNGSGITIAQLKQLQPFPWILILRDAGDNGLEFATGWQRQLGGPQRAHILDPVPATKDPGDLGPLPNGRELAAALVGSFLTPPPAAHQPLDTLEQHAAAEAKPEQARAPHPALPEWRVGSRVQKLPLMVCPNCAALAMPGRVTSCCGHALQEHDKVYVLWIRGVVFDTSFYTIDKSYIGQS